MSNIIYQTPNFKITDKYIQHGNEIMPISALSFITYQKQSVLPFILLLVSIVLISIILAGAFSFPEFLLLILFLAPIPLLKIIFNKRYYCFYSHSGKCISIEFRNEDPKLNSAIFSILTMEFQEAKDTDTPKGTSVRL